jgi:hypothetical protein
MSEQGSSQAREQSTGSEDGGSQRSNRERGKKSSRDSDSAIFQLMEMMQRERKEDRKESREKEERLLKLINEQKEQLDILRAREGGLETASISSLGTGTNSSELSELHQMMRKEKAMIESSRGVYRSDLLEGHDLPEEWPVYSWPKGWRMRNIFARALISMGELQAQHLRAVEKSISKEDILLTKKEKLSRALDLALNELKTQLRVTERFLRREEYAILEPLVNGASEDKREYPLAHIAWEVCMLGNKELPIATPALLHTCRTLAPLIVGGIREWEQVVVGIGWPSSETKGFRVGKPMIKRHMDPIKKTTPQTTQQKKGNQ